MRKLKYLPVLVPAFVILMASVVYAWHPEPSESQDCVATHEESNTYDLQWKLEYPTEQWSSTDFPMYILDNDRGVTFDKNPVGVGETATATETVQGAPGEEVVLNGHVHWKNAEGKILHPQSFQITIVLGDDCPPPPTTTTTTAPPATTTTVPLPPATVPDTPVSIPPHEELIPPKQVEACPDGSSITWTSDQPKPACPETLPKTGSVFLVILTIGGSVVLALGLATYPRFIRRRPFTVS